MRKIPAALNAQFDALLVKNKIPQKFHICFNRQDMVKGRTFESREEPAILEKAMNPSGGTIIIGVLVVASPGM